jgi:hypothetical protein
MVFGDLVWVYMSVVHLYLIGQALESDTLTRYQTLV